MAADAREARGSTDGVATVRFEGIGRDGRRPCRAVGTIEEVESGPALRRGDRIEIALPSSCVTTHPLAVALARPGLVRFYGASGAVRFLEPVAEGRE